MQKVFLVDISPSEYQKMDKSFPFPNLSSRLCPHCHKNLLHKHGFYSRYLIARGFEGLIRIRRFICPYCGRTVSLLPWFCHPRRTYSMGFIHYCLYGFFHHYGSMASFIHSFSVSSGILFSRQLLRQYICRILKNSNRILMDLIRQFHLPSPPSFSLDIKKRVKDALDLIETMAPTPYSVSMNMFSHGFCTYLTL